MTSPFWQKILKCRKYETNNTARACRGFVPLQRSSSGMVRCNLGGYECVDRSDQGDCSGREKSSQDVRLNKSRNIRWTSFFSILSFSFHGLFMWQTLRGPNFNSAQEQLTKWHMWNKMEWSLMELAFMSSPCADLILMIQVNWTCHFVPCYLHAEMIP